MRPDKSGVLLSPQEDGMCVYLLRDQPIESILKKIAALDIGTNQHGPVGTQLHPIHVHRMGQQIATAFDNPDNQGKPLAERKALYSATLQMWFGKWFAFGNGPWRPILNCRAEERKGKESHVPRLPKRADDGSASEPQLASIISDP